MYMARWTRILGFLALPMASIASPFLALPAVTSRFGAAAWVAVAIGQSIGSSLAVIVELAWSLTGPQRVSRASLKMRQQILSLSILSKFAVFLPLAGLAAWLGFILSAEYRWETSLVAVGAAAVGLSSVWFYIGTGQVSKIFLTDAFPRVFCVCGSSFFLYLGSSLWVYPLMGILLPSLLAPTLSICMEKVRPRHIKGLSVVRLLTIIKLQGQAMSGRALSSIYIALPVTFVSIVAPDSVAVFAAAERLQRICLQVLTAVPNVMQRWVGGGATQVERITRAKRSVGLCALVGFIAGLTFTLLGPAFADFVFSGVIHIPYIISSISGCLIFTVCISKATGSLALVAAKRISFISYSALLGALIGIPSIVLGVQLFGVVGALTAEVLAELTVLGVQMYGVFWYKKKAPSSNLSLVYHA